MSGTTDIQIFRAIIKAIPFFNACRERIEYASRIAADINHNIMRTSIFEQKFAPEMKYIFRVQSVEQWHGILGNDVLAQRMIMIQVLLENLDSAGEKSETSKKPTQQTQLEQQTALTG